MVRPGPVERVRRDLAARRGPELARHLPDGFQRLGSVILVRWPDVLRPEFPALAERLRAELGAETVLRVLGPARGAWRVPHVERLAGGPTVTEVREDGLRFRLDAARILYAAGNRTERARIARLPAPTETVVDLFAGIGYFALPIARHARPARVLAVEENPESFEFLQENIRRNRLLDRVEALRGDNRRLPLDAGIADRVLLGWLPDTLPWVPRAIGLLRDGRGWLHVHRLVGSRAAPGSSEGAVRRAVAAAGSRPAEATERPVKPYGPGRVHVVVDVRVEPDRRSGSSAP